MLITNEGTIIRTPVDGIPFYSRSAGGVIVMRLAEGSTIVNFARVASDAETAAEAEAADEIVPELEIADITDVEKEDLAEYFPEIEKYSGECNFRDCRHINEPGCSVKKAVEEGNIAQSRYESYKEIFSQLGEINKWENA